MPKLAHPAESVRTEWRSRIEAEYRSATIVHHLTLWLMQLGAPPELLRAGLRIAADELKHAELSHHCFVAAGGVGGPVLPRETLGLTRRANDRLELDVARIVVEMFCLGETVAVPLFKLLREGATIAPARKALDRILVDEVRHRDFGWLGLEWLLSLPEEQPIRALIDAELPRYFAQVRRNYASATNAEITEEERSWGLMAPATYKHAAERTLTRDWVPRFARFDIDAAAAWENVQK
jgi:hypothetical protein